MATATVPSAETSAFQWKPDLKAYPEYKRIEDWPIWIFRVKNIMLAQGMEEVLDPTYTPDPNDLKAVKEWKRKQHFTYMMLAEQVMGHTSKQIVRQNEATRDGQRTIIELDHQAKRSTEAILAGRRTMAQISNQRYDPKTGSALEFITKFEEMIEAHNMQQTEPEMVLTGAMKKSFLQSSLANVMMLRAVTDRENDMIVRGGSAFTYDEYLQAAKASAALYDQKSSGQRSVNVNKVDSSKEVDSFMHEATEYFVNMTKKRAPGATMNKETWQTISEDGKTIWDKLTSSDKQKILQYAMKRAAAKETVSVNQTMIQELDQVFSQTEEEALAPTLETDEVLEAEVNQAISKARSEAHPGDIRRVLSGKPQKKAVTQVKFAQWIDEDPYADTGDEDQEIDHLLDEYDWDPDDEYGDQDF
jgi:uncharacterized protein (UPF0128 family)